MGIQPQRVYGAYHFIKVLPSSQEQGEAAHPSHALENRDKGSQGIYALPAGSDII